MSTENTTPPSAFINQDEAAQLLGLTNPRTLAAWRLRRCGPPYQKIGKRLVRYDRVAVLAWASTQQVDS